jgi:hypothetical protein
MQTDHLKQTWRYVKHTHTHITSLYTIISVLLRPEIYDQLWQTKSYWQCLCVWWIFAWRVPESDVRNRVNLFSRSYRGWLEIKYKFRCIFSFILVRQLTLMKIVRGINRTEEARTDTCKGVRCMPEWTLFIDIYTAEKILKWRTRAKSIRKL